MFNALPYNRDLKACFGILRKQDRTKIVIVSVIQVFLTLLDLVGVVLIGLIATISVNGYQTGKPLVSNNFILGSIWGSSSSYKSQILVVGVIAVIALVSKSLLSIFFTRKIVFFLSRRGASISGELSSRLLSQPILKIQDKSTQERLFSLTNGVQLIMMNVLATAAVLVADISLLIVMFTTLIVADVGTALATLILFSVTGLVLYKIMYLRASQLGEQSSLLTIRSAEKILEVFSSYRETIVRNRRQYYSKEIAKTRFNLSEVTAEVSFMPFVSKYVVEIALVLGGVIIGFFQFTRYDTATAFTNLTIFIVAGSRIAPAFLRVQQSIVQISGGVGAAGPTLELIRNVRDCHPTLDQEPLYSSDHLGFIPKVEINQLTFSYPGKENPAVASVSINIEPGNSVAIVGPSGSGKSTIVDAILGILTPNSGTVAISGVEPLAAFKTWPGSVSYVPQEIFIANSSIRENVALGFPRHEISDENVLNALDKASLSEFLQSLPEGLDTLVGEHGTKISGGQRQRLGIARALFTNPQLLVLDEATSALDGETELAITEAIQKFQGTVTVIMIAHRLATVRSADMIVYIENGKVVASGTFEEVRQSVPDFDRQALLMGL